MAQRRTNRVSEATAPKPGPGDIPMMVDTVLPTPAPHLEPQPLFLRACAVLRCQPDAVRSYRVLARGAVEIELMAGAIYTLTATRLAEEG